MVKSCLERCSPCVSLKIITHLRTFISQSDSCIQQPRSINICNNDAEAELESMCGSLLKAVTTNRYGKAGRESKPECSPICQHTPEGESD